MRSLVTNLLGGGEGLLVSFSGAGHVALFHEYDGNIIESACGVAAISCRFKHFLSFLADGYGLFGLSDIAKGGTFRDARLRGPEARSLRISSENGFCGGSLPSLVVPDRSGRHSIREGNTRVIRGKRRELPQDGLTSQGVFPRAGRG